jgi:hypothetical protein
MNTRTVRLLAAELGANVALMKVFAPPFRNGRWARCSRKETAVEVEALAGGPGVVEENLGWASSRHFECFRALRLRGPKPQATIDNLEEIRRLEQVADLDG